MTALDTFFPFDIQMLLTAWQGYIAAEKKCKKFWQVFVTPTSILLHICCCSCCCYFLHIWGKKSFFVFALGYVEMYTKVKGGGQTAFYSLSLLTIIPLSS